MLERGMGKDGARERKGGSAVEERVKRAREMTRPSLSFSSMAATDMFSSVMYSNMLQRVVRFGKCGVVKGDSKMVNCRRDFLEQSVRNFI